MRAEAGNDEATEKAQAERRKSHAARRAALASEFESAVRWRMRRTSVPSGQATAVQRKSSSEIPKMARCSIRRPCQGTRMKVLAIPIDI